MPQITALMALALFLAINSLAEASKHPRGTSFSATVDDGTPKVIHMKRSKVSKEEEVVTQEAALEEEEKEEFLEDLVVKAPPKLKKAKIKKAPEPEDEQAQDDGESLDSGAVSMDLSGIESQLKNIQKENASMKSRLESLEAQDSKPVAEQPKEEPKVEAPKADTPKAEAPKAMDTAQMRTAAEKVPSEKVEEMRLRARYAEKILSEFNLAYDYRTVTLKDFRRIYSKLKAARATQDAMQAEN